MDRWCATASRGRSLARLHVGITDDGTFVGSSVRVGGRARRNGERPTGRLVERGREVFAGEVTFLDSSDVTTCSRAARTRGFVQVIEGICRTGADAFDDGAAQRRDPPDASEIIGATVAVRDGGDYVQTIYFTSEADARGREGQPHRVASDGRGNAGCQVLRPAHPMMMSPVKGS